MVMGKSVTGGGFVTIENGKAYLFDYGGNFVKEDAINQYSYGCNPLSIISLLTSGNNLDVAYADGENVKRISANKDADELIMLLQRTGGFIRMLNRRGKFENTRYAQVLFIYNATVDLTQTLANLKLV